MHGTYTDGSCDARKGTDINLNAYNGRLRFSGDLLPNNYQGNSPLPRFFISICLEACTCELNGARDKVKEEI